LRTELLKRTRLTGTHAPGAQHIGFDDAHERRVGLGGLFCRHVGRALALDVECRNFRGVNQRN
jgi:hypothetical protein